MRVLLLGLAFAAALLVFSPARAGAQPVPALALNYTEFKLPNGMNVILHEDHSTPLVSVNVWHNVGSARELPGRTGFAHLFEHLMFMGSGHVKYGQFDELLEAAGGTDNASTGNDTTNYWINVPSNALELALYLESDRLGYLLDAMTPQTVDAQRDVVKNERRQRIENVPYGTAQITLNEMLYPAGHPYHWPVIGYMPDLTAASYDDVVAFFKKYYTPANTSLAIAGDIDPVATRKLVEKWFSDIKPGPPVEPITVPGVALTGVQRKTITDHVQLPRLYLAWLTPSFLTPSDSALDVLANILAGGRSSRLYRRLVYDEQIAQSVSARQDSQNLSSQFVIQVTPRPGHTLDEVKAIVDEEIRKLQTTDPSEHEVQRAVNQFQASYYSRLESVGGFGGKADQLNGYFIRTGDPDYFNQDVARYTSLSPADIRAVALAFLPADRRVELSVVPEAPK